MRIRAAAATLGRALRGDERARYAMAERIARRLHRDAIVSEMDRYWLHDAEFERDYLRFEQTNRRRMDRIWTLREYAHLVRAAEVPGDTAECGVYHGLSSFIICRAMAGSGTRHHLFDTFAGLSAPGDRDEGFWQEHDLAVPEETVRRNLVEFASSVEYHKGSIPERFGDVEGSQFALVHIDVDLYEPTKDSFEFFRPRMSPRGVIVFDDYGFETCAGARAAVDEVCAARADVIVELPTGQAILLC